MLLKVTVAALTVLENVVPARLSNCYYSNSRLQPHPTETTPVVLIVKFGVPPDC